MFMVTQFANAAEKYGEAFTGKGKTIALDNLDKTYEQVKGQLIQVEGEVKKVCEKKGCWMAIADKKGQTRVTFKGYSFFVPMKLKGQKVKLEGKLLKKEQSVGEQKHLLSDGGASKEEMDQVKSSKTVFEIEATAVVTI